jgi:hypothetical protein
MLQPEFIERFWGKVDKSDRAGCWPYLEGPHFWYIDKPIRVHRFAYMAVHGEIPEGRSVWRRCNKNKCVRPAHLYVGPKGQCKKSSVDRVTRDLLTWPEIDRRRNRCERRQSQDRRGSPDYERERRNQPTAPRFSDAQIKHIETLGGHLDDRVQMEDRNHRIGQVSSPTEQNIVDALQKKNNTIVDSRTLHEGVDGQPLIAPLMSDEDFADWEQFLVPGSVAEEFYYKAKRAQEDVKELQFQLGIGPKPVNSVTQPATQVKEEK